MFWFCFNNIFLDYKATEEFAKYLERVEIVEHDFKVIQKRLFRKPKETQQDSVWTAKFYFTKIPKKGYLEIFYL